jgi:D-3-phosphoglycerate dehydrogenase
VLADGRTVSVSGTLSGPKHVEKIVEVLGYDIEVVPAEHMAFLRYTDRPGIVGTVGRVLGEADVNIAGMQVSRTGKGGDALVAMTVDQAVPVQVLDDIVAAIGAEWGRTVDLDG